MDLSPCADRTRYPAAPGAAGAPPDPPAISVEVSIVMPCLNEVDTVGTCVSKARAALEALGIAGEVIVADNGSTDGSIEIALQHGARVVHAAARGYGHALMTGIAAASGRFIVMGDADDSYDFGELPAFVAKLKEGFELVQGCRLPSGGGRIAPQAMPASHRWFGNPVLTRLARWMFRAPVHDIYCGMRGFTRELALSLDQRCTGMEFAVEMIVKASVQSARMAEVPITLHPDGRRAHAPHLRTMRDGWRTVRFLLLYSPRWLFLYPGTALIALGALGYGLALPAGADFRINFDAHTLLVASLFVLLGHQSIMFAICARTFAVSERLLPPDPALTRILSLFTLERGLGGGLVVMVSGGSLVGVAAHEWRASGFGNLDYAHTMRWVIPGVTLTALGFQTMLSSFFISILTTHRK